MASAIKGSEHQLNLYSNKTDLGDVKKNFECICKGEFECISYIGHRPVLCEDVYWAEPYKRACASALKTQASKNSGQPGVSLSDL